jgi:1-pyrroline-5-carboxylate dehydrogenase
MADLAATQARRHPPAPVNEPVRSYAPGTPDREALKARLTSMAKEDLEIPLIIGGREVRTGKTQQTVMPFSHRHVLAEWHMADARHVRQAIDAARRAGREWSGWPWEDRAAVFLRAAELLATEWRATINAATMLGQAKTAFQAEIDAACELIDFWRFNVAYAAEIYADQPLNSPGVWNQSEYRALEGFVYAVSPFNFTSIAGNLPTAPALMGGATVWKPAASAMLSAYHIMRLLMDAGLPPGVVNFVPGDAETISHAALSSPELAGIHFTGSTAVFQRLWQQAAQGISRYRSYPRLVGETGGKDFVLVHPSADAEAVAVAIARGGYEYQGQKCSAASRIYVAQSIWPEVRDRLIAMIKTMKMGDVRDFRNFLSAVIDRRAFEKIAGYLALAKQSAKILQGGRADDRTGFFVEPTLVQVKAPAHRLMVEEIFGPLVTV